VKAKIIIPTGYRKLATGSYAKTGDYVLQSTSNTGVDVLLEWKLLNGIDFVWRVNHSVYVIRSRSRARSGGERATNKRVTQAA
jgi:hypothetical protein